MTAARSLKATMQIHCEAESDVLSMINTCNDSKKILRKAVEPVWDAAKQDDVSMRQHGASITAGRQKSGQLACR